MIEAVRVNGSDLDHFDRKILALLQADGCRTMTFPSRSTCRHRNALAAGSGWNRMASLPPIGRFSTATGWDSRWSTSFR
jgi:hypothetical protein